MKKIMQLCLVLSATLLFSSCDFVVNTIKYRNITEEFVEALLKEDYDKCTSYMAMDHELARNISTDTLKSGLRSFRQVVVENWGTRLDYSFIRSEKKYLPNQTDRMPPHTTYLFVEFDNNKDLGVFQVLFDDKSGKILNIKTLDMKYPVPSMFYFWLFGGLAMCIPVFNVYIIRKIKRSNLRRKWLKYIAVVVLNVPAIKYGAFSGLSFHLLNIQLLFGVGYDYGGLLTSSWSFGIPMGGLYWFWKLKHKTGDEMQEHITPYESTPDTELQNNK